jgi:hypothetical protein
MSIYLPPFVQVNPFDSEEHYVATSHIVSIDDTTKDPPAWRITTADHRTFLISPHVAERLLQGAVKDPWGQPPQTELPQELPQDDAA